MPGRRFPAAKEVLVLEQLFFPRKVRRIRRCWLAADIERYLAWLRQRGFNEHLIRDRVPPPVRFGRFTWERDVAPAVSTNSMRKVFGRLRREVGIGASAGLGPLLHAFFVEHLTGKKGCDVPRCRATATRCACCSCSSPRTSDAGSPAPSSRTSPSIGCSGSCDTSKTVAATAFQRESTARRAAHLLRVRRQPRPGDVRDVPADRGDPDQADSRACHAVPRARRDRCPVRPAAIIGATCRARSRAGDLSVQHRRAGAGSGRSAGRAPRSRARTPARLHGKGGKRHTCPLWDETARLLRQFAGESPSPRAPVFCSAAGKRLTRFGIYKLVRRHTARFQDERSAGRRIPAPRLSAYDRRSSVGGRRRGQCDPRLARAHQPRHDESLRGHQHPHQGGCPSPVCSAAGGRWPEGTCAGLAERRDNAGLALVALMPAGVAAVGVQPYYEPGR